ncbi:MAG: hypothetical protein HON98_00830 [Chloroflexi bacterium]|jgi:hypothetical protein|nr:hypothetical protein [Chloroflexota bacterium]MBT3669669.1 hypothetical protein [Chloroflexota bacterium]MBT4003570.1 hypothetical protein [Chloroflexota bacterium]MBT4305080.1 hypothetical protein [Chloroflexota bacterium]MBT4533399.1 hypothetical protein [Chloroflexota bacterium]
MEENKISGNDFIAMGHFLMRPRRPEKNRIYRDPGIYSLAECHTEKIPSLYHLGLWWEDPKSDNKHPKPNNKYIQDLKSELGFSEKEFLAFEKDLANERFVKKTIHIHDNFLNISAAQEFSAKYLDLEIFEDVKLIGAGISIEDHKTFIDSEPYNNSGVDVRAKSAVKLSQKGVFRGFEITDYLDLFHSFYCYPQAELEIEEQKIQLNENGMFETYNQAKEFLLHMNKATIGPYWEGNLYIIAQFEYPRK